MPNNPTQISIRELMILILFAAVGLGGLLTGGLLASAVIGVSAFLTTSIAIVAFVGHREIRVKAIGFLIPVIAYELTVLSLGASEFAPYTGRLPTTKFLQPVHRLMVRTAWIDMTTGKVVPDYNPATDPSRNAGGAGGLGGMGGMMTVLETPDRAAFMSLAHVLLGKMFGYIGAKFAVYVHNLAPRVAINRDEQSDPSKSPVGRDFEL
jgi:hypothetical protein